MSNDKQIEEMARDICRVKGSCNDVCKPLDDCRAFKYAQRAYEKGYRKASDVASEIFEEIEKIAMHGVTSFGLCLMSMGEVAFAELKKKYESEGEG